MTKKGQSIRKENRRRSTKGSRGVLTEKGIESMSPAELTQSIHELMVRQEELRIQNEYLKETRRALSEVRRRYSDIFDFAPIGYLILDKNDIILEANQTASNLLGLTKKKLIQCNLTAFMKPKSADVFYLTKKRSIERENTEICEIDILKADDTYSRAELHITSIKSTHNVRVTMVDRTARYSAQQELTQHHASLQAILDATPHGIVVLEGEEGKITYINSRALDLYKGDPRGLEIKNHSASVIKHMDMDGMLYPVENLPTTRALKCGEYIRGEEMVVERQDGSRIIVGYQAAPIQDKTGKITGAVGIFEDITERKEIEITREEQRRKMEGLLGDRDRELGHKEANFRHLFNSMMDGAVVVDTSDIVRFANPAALELFNTTADKFIGTRFGMSVVDGTTEIDLVHEGRASTAEVRTTDVDWSGEQANLIILRDITLKKQAEEWNRTLSSRLIETQEKERRRIGHELHDEIGGSLTALKLALDRARRVVEDQAKVVLDEANELLDHTIDYVRTLSHSMRPSILDDFGLQDALKLYLDRYTKQTGIRVDFSNIDCPKRFQENIETVIYRIVQEALTNTAKYSGASVVTVDCHHEEGTLCVTIEDNGCGFEATMVPQESMGLRGMYDRALLIGGTVTIYTTPGYGTRVICEVPVEPLT